MSKASAALLGFLLSMAGSLFAQSVRPVSAPDDQIFDLPHYSIAQAYHIDLGKGNYLELEMAKESELSRFQNLDSLLLVFLADMKPFKDSFADPLSGKRVDYRIDTSGRKMVRIRETRSSGTSFLLGDADPSLLRLRQDTVYFLLAAKKSRFDRLMVVLNSYSNLEGLVATGLNKKIQEMLATGKNTWSGGMDTHYLLKDPSITTKNDSVYSLPQRNNFLEFEAIVSLQNYKDRLTPSADLGVEIGLHDRRFVHQLGLYWEPLFLFGSDTKGRTQTWRNDLLVFHYALDASGTIKDPLTPVGLNTNFSLGYFIRRSGDYFEKSSWRLTAGEIRLHGNRMLLQPCIYFNNLFKNVTPGLRLCYRAF